MMLFLKSNKVFFILAILLLAVDAVEEEKSEKEKVLTPQEVTTKKPDVLDQQKDEKPVDIKPFESTDITVVSFKNGSFANVSDCLYFYQRGGSVKLRTLANNNRTEQIHHLTFEHEPSKKKGKCFRNATEHTVSISLTFKLMNDTKSAGTLKVGAMFVKSRQESWKVENMYAKLKNPSKDFKFTCTHLETPIEFSYSCKAFAIHATNGSDKLILHFNNLQIQPFYTGKVFADSFDCSTLFTLGSWMGLVVVWIFTIVVAVGAYSLLSIKTMDRFDNAKGKSIINVAATDQ